MGVWNDDSARPARRMETLPMRFKIATLATVVAVAVLLYVYLIASGFSVYSDGIFLRYHVDPDATRKDVGVAITGDRPFVTTWKTTSPSESITIPVGNATGAYTVDWGDGSMSANVTGDQAHAYEDAGTYTVAITGNFERIYLNGDRNNAPRLKSIEQWGVHTQVVKATWLK